MLEADLREEVESPGARVLLLDAGECHWSYPYSDAELYRCNRSESPSADLIADPSDLSSLPSGCFDAVVVGNSFAEHDDLAIAARELCRVLIPAGTLLTFGFPDDERRQALVNSLSESFDIRIVVGVDPVTRVGGEVYLGTKDSTPLGPQPPAPTELVGYAYHLSRKTGRRVVFCLDGPLSPGERLPVQSINGETVGQVTIGAYAGERASPPEPWSEGFRYPPRASFELSPSLPSGVYTLAGRIPFVHRRAGTAKLAVLIPSNTATAFNDAGGRSLYDTDDSERADVLSFQRPLDPLVLLERTWPFMRWFSGASPCPQETTYLLDADLEESDALDAIEVLVVIGRSEYWTRAMREHFDAFVERGGRALLLCSELMYWQVRVDPMRQTMYRYAEDDPHPNPLLRTTVWHHPSLKYPIFPRTGCELSHGGFSATREGLGWGGMRIVCANSPILADTDLGKDDVVLLPDASVWDGAPVSRGGGGELQVDFGDTPPARYEVVGYNLVRPIAAEGPLESPATSLWMVLRPTARSGTVIHCGTLGWCGPCAIGLRDPNSFRVRAIILRMLTLLLEDAWPFSTPAPSPADS